MFKLVNLTAECLHEPLGVENKNIRFGWNIVSNQSGVMQESYRITVATSKEKVDTPDMWDSEEIVCGRSDNIVYKGKELSSSTEYWFTVTVTAQTPSGPCTVSAESSFETALYDENFSAKWIAQREFRYTWASYLRKEFNVPDSKKISRCRAYFSGLGVGELYINGNKIGDSVFDPAQTNYEKIVPYVCYDVTKNITSGANAVGILLGDGWYNQRQAWYQITHFGDCRTLLEIHIFFTDGTVQKVLSDESFKCDFSPITYNNVYGGETYDARLEQDGWCSANFDDTSWKNAVFMDPPGGKLTSLLIPPIRKVREVFPVKMTTRHEGSNDQVFIYDMGENFAGFVRIKIPDSPPGSRYVLRFAEETDYSGGLWYTSTGSQHTTAMQQDIYIAKGFGRDTHWEPRFTYHGFRYVEVSGVQTFKVPEDDFLIGYAVNTDLESKGNFVCSNEYINKIHELMRRTILSNYHGFPEDCPVREKCGWLGDAQLVSEAAIFNFNMFNAYEKYLEDIRTSKEIYGTWQMIAPGRRTCGNATPLWGCAQVIIPWNMYVHYNDISVLEKYYDLMSEWIEHELNRSKDYIIDEGLGDWCPPRATRTEADPNGERFRLPVAVSSTAEFYKCTETMIKVANILRKENDAAKFNKLAASIKEAFICKFYDSKKNSFKTQGADGVALRYGLYPTGCAELLALDYKRILEKDGYSMYTGIYANKHSIPAMTEYGYGSEMLSALISPENNNFRKMIESGATSLYECFVSPQEESDPGSLNHPMQGAFTSWFYTHILGIRASENNPGYKEIIVRPYVFDGIENASGHYDTVYGRVSVSWSLKDNMFTLDVTLPANTYGKIEIPAVNGFEFDSIRCIDSSGDTLSPVFHGEISSIAVTNGKYVVTANT